MTLKDYLTERAETVEQFADRVNESPHTIAKLYRGDRFPRLDLTQRIIAATNGAVTADDLMEAAVARQQAQAAAKPTPSDLSERVGA